MKKEKREITLREHLTAIGSKGGAKRAENLTAAQLSKIGKQGGKIGGKARAAALTPAKRKAIAKAAAAKRWEGKETKEAE